MLLLNYPDSSVAKELWRSAESPRNTSKPSYNSSFLLVILSEISKILLHSQSRYINETFCFDVFDSSIKAFQASHVRAH